MLGIQTVTKPKTSVVANAMPSEDMLQETQVIEAECSLEQAVTTDESMGPNEEVAKNESNEKITELGNSPTIPSVETESSDVITQEDTHLDNIVKDVTKLLSPSIGIFDEETDSESDTEAVFIKRSSRGRTAFLSDDDDDDEDDFPSTSNNGQESGKKDIENDKKNEEHSGNLFKSDLYDAESESESEKEQEEDKKRRKRGRATILSDDDDDDDDDEEAGAKKKSPLVEDGSDSEPGSGSDGETSSKRLVREKDDLSDQSQEDKRPDVSERAKSPQKGSRTPKPRRLKKEAIQKIHSETQRLIRESALRLPYHKPKQLTVNDFFNKRPSARPLKPLRGLARVVTKEKKPEPVEKKDDAELLDPFSSKREKPVVVTGELLNKDVVISDNFDSQTVAMTTEHIAMTESITSSLTVQDGEEGKGGTGTNNLQNNDSLVSEGRSTLIGQNSSELCPEEGKDQSETEVKKDQQFDGLENSMEIESLVTSPEGTMEGQQNPPGGVKVTPASSTKKQSTAMRLLQASLDKFKNITPKLSGEANRVICLDKEEEHAETEIPTGVENLMERFARHSNKKTRGRKTQQEVQLSIIKKETNEDGKEDLKEEKISFILEPDEEEINPKLRVPGAKLVHLKETLQQRMKERREQERKKRQEAYNIDNEEMEGEEEEEEAELSDGEMSDEDRKTGAAAVDSEEDDDDYIPDDERVKEKHMFADDEAEDDDDEDSDVEDEDDYGMTGKSKSQKTATPKSITEEDDGDEISTQSRKKKASSKRRILLSDDEDDDGVQEESVMKANETESSEPKDAVHHGTPRKPLKVPDIHHEISNLSSISSKTSSVKKSDSSSVTRYFPDIGKTMDLFDSTSFTDDKNNDLTSDDKPMTFNLKEHLGRQDSVNSKTSEADNNSLPSLDDSFEMFPATIPPYQPRRESLDDSDDGKFKEAFTLFSRAKSNLQNSSAKSTTKFPELSLPVEDSQDLFRMDTPSLMIPDSQREGDTQNFRFSFEDDETQTQFLDSNGLLKKNSAKRPGPRKIFQTENASQGNMDELLDLCSGQFNPDNITRKVFHNENASQGNMDELLGLCSGRFAKQDDSDSERFDKNEGHTQGNMNELLGLCSGQFKEDGEDQTHQILPSQTSFKRGLFSQVQTQDNVSELMGLCSGNFSSKLHEDKVDVSKEKSKDESDKESVSSFSLVFDQETLKEELGEEKQEDGESSDDEPIIITRKRKPVKERGKEEEDGLLLAYDSNDEAEVEENLFQGQNYSKFAKKRFFDQEAELSGSEGDSDEDYDAEEEPDELELDKEAEEQFKDTEKLREQVNEIYMKTTEDDDSRRLRLLQELYLRDGDLHSDKSRVRRFRWKNLVEMEMDAAGGVNNDSEDEGAEEDDQDTQWRLQRYQREQWLREQDKEKGQKAAQEPAPVTENEDSQFSKLMKIVSRNNSKGSSVSSGTESNPAPPPVEEIKKKKEFNSPKPLKMHKHGSFLKRNKKELEKLASVVKPLVNPTGPKNSSRGFIFQSLSQTNVETTEKPSQPSKVKRSISVQDPLSHHSEGPQSKRPKLDRSFSQQVSSGSIFNHF